MTQRLTMNSFRHIAPTEDSMLILLGGHWTFMPFSLSLCVLHYLFKIEDVLVCKPRLDLFLTAIVYQIGACGSLLSIFMPIEIPLTAKPLATVFAGNVAFEVLIERVSPRRQR